MAAPKGAAEKQRQMVLRALTDAKFRKMLQTDPKTALSLEKVTPEIQKEIRMVLAAVKGIHTQIGAIAHELLCAYGVGKKPTRG